MDASLQPLEAGGLALLVERDDFAVEDEPLPAPARPARERRRDFLKLPRLLVAEARPETDLAASRRYLRDGADAVVLRLRGEVRVVERRVGQRREQRLQGVIHAGWALGTGSWRYPDRRAHMPGVRPPAPGPTSRHYYAAGFAIAAGFAMLRASRASCA